MKIKQALKKIVLFIFPRGTGRFNWLYYHFYWKPEGEIGRYIQNYSREKGKGKMTFIQVGANDGFTGDNIFWFIKYHLWSGILIEPVGYLFEKLKRTYKHCSNQLFFENVAISEKDEIKEFYYIENFQEDQQYPEWLKQLGSFKKEHVEWVEKAYPGLQMKAEKINCVLLTSLVEKYNYHNLDFLYIDVEGYDFEIIKSIDFSKLNPRLIYYEHRHLSSEDKENSKKFLTEKGYDIIAGEFDNLAITK